MKYYTDYYRNIFLFNNLYFREFGGRMWKVSQRLMFYFSCSQWSIRSGCGKTWREVCLLKCVKPQMPKSHILIECSEGYRRLLLLSQTDCHTHSPIVHLPNLTTKASWSYFIQVHFVKYEVYLYYNIVVTSLSYYVVYNINFLICLSSLKFGLWNRGQLG